MVGAAKVDEQSRALPPTTRCLAQLSKRARHQSKRALHLSLRHAERRRRLRASGWQRGAAQAARRPSTGQRHCSSSSSTAVECQMRPHAAPRAADAAWCACVRLVAAAAFRTHERRMRRMMLRGPHAAQQHTPSALLAVARGTIWIAISRAWRQLSTVHQSQKAYVGGNHVPNRSGAAHTATRQTAKLVQCTQCDPHRML